MTNKFKVGDRVRRICDSSSTDMQVGDIGRVTKVDDDGGLHVLKEGATLGNYHCADNVELVERASKPEFEVGDKITVKKPCSSAKPGVVYTLERSGAGNLFCTNGNGTHCCSCKDNFVRVTDSDSTGFEVGDRVKLKDYNGCFDGNDHREETAKITDLECGMCGDVVIRWSDYVYSCVKKDNLIKISDSDSTTVQTNKMEANKMELKNIKKENLTEARKKYDEEYRNDEVEAAMNELRKATDSINRIDREIKAREEEKKPHLEVLAKVK